MLNQTISQGLCIYQSIWFDYILQDNVMVYDDIEFFSLNSFVVFSHNFSNYTHPFPIYFISIESLYFREVNTI